MLLVTYLFFAWRDLAAWHFSDTGDREGLERAGRLEPGNAEFNFRLGRYWLFLQQDAARARPLLRRATELNGHEARYWLDLALAERALGDSAAAHAAIEQALRLEPRTPEVLWEAGNALLATGETRAALVQFHDVIAYSPDLGDAAMDVSWRATHDARAIVELALPAEPVPHLKFLSTLLAQDDAANAALVWEHLVGLRKPFNLSQAFPYVDYLLRRGDGAAARAAWRDLDTVNPSFAAYQPGDNLIVNGGFEMDLLNTGFDWRYQKQVHVVATIVTDEVHGGARSLQLQFEGSDVNDTGLAQAVVLEAGNDYALGCYARTQNVEGGGALRFEVRGPENAVPWQSDPIPLSPTWQASRAVVHAGASGIYQLRLVRVPSGTLYRGTVWIDDVTLVRK